MLGAWILAVASLVGAFGIGHWCGLRAGRQAAFAEAGRWARRQAAEYREALEAKYRAIIQRETMASYTPGPRDANGSPVR